MAIALVVEGYFSGCWLLPFNRYDSDMRRACHEAQVSNIFFLFGKEGIFMGQLSQYW